MTLERIKGHIVWLCNSCEDELETDTSDFGTALETLRGASWSIRAQQETQRKPGEWLHFCPTCQERRG